MVIHFMIYELKMIKFFFFITIKNYVLNETKSLLDDNPKEARGVFLISFVIVRYPSCLFVGLSNFFYLMAFKGHLKFNQTAF